MSDRQPMLNGYSSLLFVLIVCSICWIITLWLCQNKISVASGIFSFCTCIGWLIGIAITPYSKKEETEFSKYTKNLILFTTGFAAAKLSAISDNIISNIKSQDDIFIFCGGAAHLIAVAIVVFDSRRYGFGKSRMKRQNSMSAII